MLIKRAALIDHYERGFLDVSRKNPEFAHKWAAFSVWFGIVFLGAIGPLMVITGLIRLF